MVTRLRDKIYGRVCLTLLGLIISACITEAGMTDLESKVKKPPLYTQDLGKKGWYAVRFHLTWDVTQAPEWYLGTWIAGEVIQPILMKYQNQLVYWRVHRRAVNDALGHQFSFIFYSTQRDATEIYQQFEGNMALEALRHQGLLIDVIYDALPSQSIGIADTSDPAWPLNIRETWPTFMMGASQMWMAQMQDIRQDMLDETDVQQRYRLIQGNMTELWQAQGQAAFIHHLSALYAYQPTLTRF